MRAPRLVLALGLLLLAGCAIVDRPCLALRSVAGGIHNRRQVSGIRPFFLPDGRLGLAANGALLIEDEPGGRLLLRYDVFAEIDDPDASPDGTSILFTSGAEQITAGGGHNDHVFQLYLLDLATGERRRLTTSRRAESLPRFAGDGADIVFVRRAEYAGWSLEDPWGKGAVFLARASGADERRLTPDLFHPFAGLELLRDDGRIVFGGTPAGASGPSVFVLDPSTTEGPRLLLADAYLPTPLAASGELLVARALEDGHGLARCDLAGRVTRQWDFRVNELSGLAVSPDGERVVFGDFDPEQGLFGRYRLWAMSIDDEAPTLEDTLEYRPTVRFKPGDLVMPPSWWFRSNCSPGSR